MKNRYVKLLFIFAFLACLSCGRNNSNNKITNHISDNERVTFKLFNYDYKKEVVKDQTFSIFYTYQSFMSNLYFIDYAFVESESENMPTKLDASNYNEKFFDNYCLMLTKVPLGMGYTYQHCPTEYTINSDTLDLSIESSGNYSWFAFENIYFLISFEKDILSGDILKMRIIENDTMKNEIWNRNP